MSEDLGMKRTGENYLKKFVETEDGLCIFDNKKVTIFSTWNVDFKSQNARLWFPKFCSVITNYPKVSALEGKEH